MDNNKVIHTDEKAREDAKFKIYQKENIENTEAEKCDKIPEVVSDEKVEAENVKLNPDENTMDRG